MTCRSSAPDYCLNLIKNILYASSGFNVLLPPARRAKAFSDGLQHNTCSQYPGFTLLIKIVSYVFCS